MERHQARAPSGPLRAAGSSSPRAIVEAWSKAHASADLDALACLYSRDAVYEHEGAVARTHGVDAIRRVIQERWKDYHSAGVAVGHRERRVFGDGERAVLEWTDPLGLPCCSVFHCRSGLIVGQRDYFDSRDYERLYD